MAYIIDKINTLKKIYPKPLDHNYDKLNYDDEGLWSITYPNEADIVSSTISNITEDNNINILDMTAGCGGNTISFCKHFTNVTAIEYNLDRFNILKNNVKCYDFNNYTLICGNSLNYINNNYDVFFIDPPWGGPEYKKQSNIELYIMDKKMNDIIDMIPVNKLIVLKLPFNYNFDGLNKYNVVLKQPMNNIIIVYLSHKIFL